MGAVDGVIDGTDVRPIRLPGGRPHGLVLWVIIWESPSIGLGPTLLNSGSLLMPRTLLRGGEPLVYSSQGSDFVLNSRPGP